MSIFLKIRGIEISKYKSAQFAELSFFLPEKNNKKQKVYVFIKWELYLVNGLKANILISNNIFAPESFVMNVKLGHALEISYRVKITIKTK